MCIGENVSCEWSLRPLHVQHLSQSTPVDSPSPVPAMLPQSIFQGYYRMSWTTGVRSQPKKATAPTLRTTSTKTPHSFQVARNEKAAVIEDKLGRGYGSAVNVSITPSRPIEIKEMPQSYHTCQYPPSRGVSPRYDATSTTTLSLQLL